MYFRGAYPTVDYDFCEPFAFSTERFDGADVIQGPFRLQQFQHTIHLSANLWLLILAPAMNSSGLGLITSECDHVNTFLLLWSAFGY